jgi:hypothetical protein
MQIYGTDFVYKIPHTQLWTLYYYQQNLQRHE